MRVLLLAVVACLLVPALAHGSGLDVIRDCEDDNRFTKEYSQKEYREALEQLGADTDEYSDCRSIIHRAQLRAAGSRGRGGSGGSDAAGIPGAPGGTGGGGGADPAAAADPAVTPPTAEEQKALDSTTARLRDSGLDAAVAGAAPDGDSDSDLPGSVILLLVALGAGVLGAGALHLRGFVLARRAA